MSHVWAFLWWFLRYVRVSLQFASLTQMDISQLVICLCTIKCSSVKRFCTKCARLFLKCLYTPSVEYVRAIAAVIVASRMFPFFFSKLQIKFGDLFQYKCLCLWYFPRRRCNFFFVILGTVYSSGSTPIALSSKGKEQFYSLQLCFCFLR
jgi:hypothetical protein